MRPHPTLTFALLLKSTIEMADDKGLPHHKEFLTPEAAHEAAGQGHAATDLHGRSLVEFDRAAERRLRLKIDFYTVPTVSILYLFCFIDRANIGMDSWLLANSGSRGQANTRPIRQREARRF